ncbi:ATP-binding protein [Streptomyces sp. MUM 178J]|uniref:ATP-binding protein n=1 Tax=Streptomyces sp. MUM 178J TaxID=2791991 RepID=UPI001F0448FA|nr:ATP-binding protein [Streptomyces sp. MUM 178J]WRQ81172.1 ATP-binding protein [Streptomyces sp. MUM 178J]
MRIPRPRSLAGQLFAMQAVLVTVIVAGCALFAYVTDRDQAEEAARRQATATATAVARSPSVAAAARLADPSSVLQPYAEGVRRDSGVDFVVIMAPDGTRWTHPAAGEIGRTYLGHIGPALRGEVYSESYTGTLGRSVRTVAPVYGTDVANGRNGTGGTHGTGETDGAGGTRGTDGAVVGVVSAGITVRAISEQAREQLTALLAVAGGALALGAVGTYVVNARLRRHTHGMNAAELSRMHDYHEAALHAVREGLVMLDGQRRIALINDGARELLGLGEDAVGRPVAELGLPAPLTGALLASEPRVDEVHPTADRVVVVSTRPVVGGERRGTVVTLRDHTELQALSGELDSERGFSQALRSQAHEAANRLHTVVSLIELGRVGEAVEFATAELELAQVLTDRVVGAVGEPVLAALLLGKAAQANERGVELVLADDSRIDDGVLPASLPARDVVTILGNLIDNAVDAASEAADVHPAAPAPEAADPKAADPDQAGPDTTDPDTTDPDTTDPDTAGPDTTGPDQADPNTAGPNTTDPKTAGPEAASPDTEHVTRLPGMPVPAADSAEANVPAVRAALADEEHADRTGTGAGPRPAAASRDRTRPAAGRSTADDGRPPQAARPDEPAPPGAADEDGRRLRDLPAMPAARRRAVVTVTARVEEDGQSLLLRVEDSGTGVDPADAEEVFRRGWSTRGADRGLGLALVRQAVRRAHGTVGIARSADGGAEFAVRLPLHAPEPAPGDRTTTVEPAPGDATTAAGARV